MSHVYPGNASLAAEVKHRVLTTFRQSVELARQGSLDDAALGCAFVLKLDPSFTPAQRLADEINAGAFVIDYDSYLDEVAEQGDPLAAAREALIQRDFSRALELASAVLRENMMDPQAQEIAGIAQERLEADPFIEQFVRKAESKLAAGDTAGAVVEIEKARKLDSSHPALLRFKDSLNRRKAPAPPPAEYDFSDGFGTPLEEPAATSPSNSQADHSSSFDASFVVDGDPLAASSAQASDFGFVFGEEQLPESPSGSPHVSAPEEPLSEQGFSFEGSFSPAPPAGSGFTDSFSASSSGSGGSFESTLGHAFGGAVENEPEVGEARTFDFSSASVETTPEEREKIAQFLNEGDELFAKSDYQAAIDAWSRIFLIDVTNEDATTRIERARLKRHALEGELDDLFGEAVAAYESGDHETAREKAGQLLFADPGRREARELIERLDAGDPAPSLTSPEIPAALDDDFFLEEEAVITGENAPLIPPGPPTSSAPPARQAQKSATPAKASRGLSLPLVAVVALLLLGAGGWYGWRMMNETPAHDPGLTEAIFAQADRLAGAGQFDEAINRLMNVASDDPQHDRAIEMIGDLRERKSQSAGLIDGRPSSEVFAENLEMARAALAERDYLGARKAFEEARAIQSLPAELDELYREASSQAAKFDTAVRLIREKKYPEAAERLEQLQRDDPENPNIRLMLSSVWFNSAVESLRKDDTREAVSQLDRALRFSAADPQIRRARELAGRYDGKEKDLLYRIFVNHLDLRE
jgi:tetratricopeptide (TPR) repeat protein